LRRTHSSFVAERSDLQMHHAALKERVDFLEGDVKDSVEQQGQKIMVTQTRLHELHARITASEKHIPVVLELQKKCEELTNSSRDFRSEHSSVKDRLDNMEALFADTSNRHSKDLKILKDAHSQQSTILCKHVSRLDAIAARHEKHVSLPDRIGTIEQQIVDTNETRTAEVLDFHRKLVHEASVRERQHETIKELITRRQQEEIGGSFTKLCDQATNLENALGKSTDKFTRELARVESLHQRLVSEAQTQSAGHTALAGRVDSLERALVEAVDKTSKELEATQEKFDTFAGRLTVIKSAWVHHAPTSPAMCGEGS